jgi:hypothetical protein
MAFGKKKSAAAPEAPAKPARVRHSKPTPPPAPVMDAPPVLAAEDEAALRDQYKGGRTWPPSHDEEW